MFCSFFAPPQTQITHGELFTHGGGEGRTSKTLKEQWEQLDLHIVDRRDG